MTTPTEQQRVREGMKLAPTRYSLYHWRSYFSFLLGRYVSLTETVELLKQEALTQETTA